MASSERTPVWMSSSELSRSPIPVLQHDRSVAKCVVGAGVAGLSVARCLVEAGHEVLVIDRAGIGAGETSRSTAHLSCALDDRLYCLEELHGAKGAKIALDSHRHAIDLIEQWSGGACGFARIDGYLFRDASSDEDVLEHEAAAAQRLGIDVRFAHIDGFTSRNERALVFPRQGRIDPAAYVGNLAKELHAAGVQFAQAEAIDLKDGAPCTIATAAGPTITADDVIVCTNVPFHRTIAYHTKQAPYRSYVIAVEAGADCFPDALLWDTGDPYHYVRWMRSGNAASDLLIVGGADHKTGQQGDADPWSQLEQWLRGVCPGAGAVRHRWSGQIIEPVDGVAFIGPDVGTSHIHVVTGDSGNGVTHGTLAGPLIAGLIDEGDHPWAALYDPARKPANKEWLKENANVAWQYRDWVTTGAPTTDDIAPVTVRSFEMGCIGSRRIATRRGTSTRSRPPVHISTASCAGTRSRKPGTAHAMVRDSMAGPAPFSMAPRPYPSNACRMRKHREAAPEKSTCTHGEAIRNAKAIAHRRSVTGTAVTLPELSLRARAACCGTAGAALRRCTILPRNRHTPTGSCGVASALQTPASGVSGRQGNQRRQQARLPLRRGRRQRIANAALFAGTQRRRPTTGN